MISFEIVLLNNISNTNNTSNINNMAKKDFKSSINQTNIPAKSGIKGLFSPSVDSSNIEKVTPITEVISVTSITQTESTSKDVRQTFIVRNDYLEKLKDYVHHKRQEGFSFYTQKEALQDVLESFFSSLEIPTRPDFIKEAEIKRANRIRKSL